jgi:hypothetical protein
MPAMNKQLSDALFEHSGGKPTLVFVSPRCQTRLTVLDLIALANTAGKLLHYATRLPRQLPDQ